MQAIAVINVLRKQWWYIASNDFVCFAANAVKFAAALYSCHSSDACVYTLTKWIVSGSKQLESAGPCYHKYKSSRFRQICWCRVDGRLIGQNWSHDGLKRLDLFSVPLSPPQALSLCTKRALKHQIVRHFMMITVLGADCQVRLDDVANVFPKLQIPAAIVCNQLLL